ncbi:uncharacterized protein LOC142625397 [Castanea sativa]|uniref:uncharacterized protein LOC142625397 n=1 Tax=Castanea sativa TaxID=21020 RepID=UPI003F652B3C
MAEEDQEKTAFITSQGLYCYKVMSFGLKNVCVTYQRFQEPILIAWSPQANEQVEVTNRTLLKIIKTRLDEAKGSWPEELPNVLWAYKTIIRTQTGETPSSLTYSTQALIPVEVGVTNLRREVFQEGRNNEELRINLDCLEESRDGTSCKMVEYQQKMFKYYNKRVKLRRLNIGDLVLRKVTPATKDPTQGKLGLTWKGPTESLITLGKTTITWRR